MHEHTFMQANQFLERHKPWLLVKDPHEHTRLRAVLGVAIETLRLSSCLLYPVIPHSTTLVLHRLGFSRTSPHERSSVLIRPSDVRCKLDSTDGARSLELGTQKMTLGGDPLFRKETKR